MVAIYLFSNSLSLSLYSFREKEFQKFALWISLDICFCVCAHTICSWNFIMSIVYMSNEHWFVKVYNGLVGILLYLSESIRWFGHKTFVVIDVDVLKFFWNRHTCNPQPQDWRKWELRGEMQNNGCPTACFLRIWGSGSGDMNNTNGKKPEVLMKRIWCIIFPRTLEET